MLTVLALSLGVSLLAYVYGQEALRLLARLAGMARPGPPAGPAYGGPSLPPFPIVAWTGLAVLSAGAGLLALVVPLGAGALAAAVAGGMLLAAGRRRALAADLAREAAALRGAGRLGLAALLLAGSLGLARAAQPAGNYDTGAYHAQAVRWLEEHGAVPGLGNLHERLAFSAGWFVPSALFGLAFLRATPWHGLNAALFLLLLVWAASALARWRGGERRSSLVLRMAAPVAALALFGRWLSSPTPDVAVAALGWAAAVLVLEQIEEGRTAEPDLAFFAATLLAAFAVAAKLSALPVLLLPGLLAARQLAAGRGRRAWRAPLVAAAAAAALLAPFVAQTAVTSGYLVFPLPGFPALDVDWAVPARLVEREARWIASWARVPHRTTQIVEAMSTREWLALWWDHLPPAPRAAVLAVLVLGPLRIVRFLARRRPGTAADGERLALEGCLFAAVAYWFLLAPDPRFGWSALLPLPLLLVLDLAPDRRRPGAALPLPGRTALPAALLLAAFAWQAWQIHGWEPRVFPTAARHLLLPGGYPRPEDLRQTAVGPLRLQVPVRNDRCWYHPFPCAPQPDPWLEPRGARLADGFRIREPQAGARAAAP